VAKRKERKQSGQVGVRVLELEEEAGLEVASLLDIQLQGVELVVDRAEVANRQVEEKALLSEELVGGE
jgi:hypothetical protein